LHFYSSPKTIFMFGTSKKRKSRVPKPPKKRKNLFWLFIRAHEVSKLLDCCERTAHRYLEKARTKAGKIRGQFVTVREFSMALGLLESAVQYQLKRIFGSKRQQ
jgi:hypothetical protein